MSSTLPRYKVKAGRFIYDLTTKKVKVSKDKGLISLFTVPASLFRTKNIKII